MANSHFPSGGSGSPGGSSTSVQYNDNGAFGGFGSWDGSTLTVDAVESAYTSSDGSAGVSAGPFTTITAITVKDGLVTAITGS